MKKLFLIPLITIMACCLIFGGLAKPAPAQPIKIGHIRPLTGHMAIVGKRMVRAADFAFEEVGYEVAGRKIEVIVGDSAARPAKAIDTARKLIERDKVDILIGPTVGGTQMAVSGYMNKVGKPHVHTNPSPFGIIAQKHQWTFMSGGQEPQISSCMGRYAYDKLGHRTVTVITGDWHPGHGFLNGFMGGFKARGGEVIQEQYPPFDCADFGPYLAALKDADAVVAWFDGTTAIRFLTQFHEFGIRKRMPLVAAFHGSFFAPFILHRLPPEAAEAVIGEYCPTPYTPLLKPRINKIFVKAWKEKFGETPEDTDSGPYQGVLAVLAALEATGGDTTPKKLRQALLEVKVKGPEGTTTFDPKTLCAIKDMYIVKVEKIEGEYIWVPVHHYKEVPPLGFAPPPGPPPGH